MDKQSAASIPSSPETCVFKWRLIDVQKQPTIKVSPLFEIQIGQAKESVTLSLNTNHNLIQISLKPSVGSLDNYRLSECISSALIVFRYGENKSEQFDKLQFRATGDCIVFEVNRLNFTVLTNDYKVPFDIEMQLNLQPAVVPSPIVPIEERSQSSPSTSVSEPENELVRVHWEMSDVKAQPLIKESPIFSFTIGKAKHQIRLSMDINNDRAQIRIISLKTNTTQFAELIDKVSVNLQPGDKRPSIMNDNLEIRKVLPDIMYLTTIKLSFAALTANYKSPLSVTMQFSFNKGTKIYKNATKQKCAPAAEKNPYSFYWHVLDFEIFPLTKTSPLFKMQLANKYMVTVQLLLMHHRNKPIRLCLTTPTRNVLADLAASIDRVTIKIMDANGLAQTFTDCVLQLADDLIWFELCDNHMHLADLTNEFRESFHILFKFHRSFSVDASAQLDHTEVPPAIQQSATPDQNPSPDQSVQQTITTEPLLIPSTDISLFIPNPQPTVLLRQFNALLADQVDCDVHFDCQGTTIGAHKTVLRTRSAFFHELFLQHNDQTMFPFKSVDAETMADTLQFIYTGTAPRISITAERLLSVANLMELPDLHELAQTHLLQKRSVNAIPSSPESISKLFDMYELRRMQPQVGAFIQTHMAELMANSHFELELKKRPEVCYELLTAIHCSKNSKP